MGVVWVQPKIIEYRGTVIILSPSLSWQQQKRLLGWETHSQEPKEKEKRVKEKLRGGRKKKRKNKRRRRR